VDAPTSVTDRGRDRIDISAHFRERRARLLSGQGTSVEDRGMFKIIQRNPNDAAVYHNRAVAYGLAGDIESAIADYTKAIEIEPNNATAYENRGRAYASKGDFTHAVADETKANELLAKATAQPIVITPKKPKKAIASKATKSVDKKATNSSWWSWPWGDAGK